MSEKCLQIIGHYGVLHQQRKLAEEVFELQEAIINAKHNSCIGISNKPCNSCIQHIVEEIADVMVLLTQFKVYYGIDTEEIEKIMNEKIDRQLWRMKNE